MLIINFKNNIPQQNHYSFSVVGNNKSNKIKFVLDRYQDEVNLSEFYAFVKVSADGGDFVDLIPLSHTVVGSEIEIVWELKRKTTQFSIVECQLSFKKTANDEDIIVWQSAIFSIELLKTIKAEQEISDKYPTILEEQEAEIENHEERIEALEQDSGGVKAVDVSLENNELDVALKDKDDEVISHDSVELPFVNKTTSANKVYGTDANGDEKLFDADSFGQVDDVQVNGYSVVVNKVAIIDLTPYATKSEVQAITDLIPAQASTENQLADKNFVNSSIATNTAYFKGTFNVVDDLNLTISATHEQVATALASAVSNPTNNDYVFVSYPDATEPTQFTKFERYKYNSETSAWAFEFELNNSSFTASQWASINSGITAQMVANMTQKNVDETITGKWEFPIGIKIKVGNYYYEFTDDNFGKIGFKRNGQYGIILDGSLVRNLEGVNPKTNNSYNIGASNLYWAEGFINKITDTKGSYDSDNTINSINASDISGGTTFSADQITLLRNGKQTKIKGDFLGMANPTIVSFMANNETTPVWYRGIVVGTNRSIVGYSFGLGYIATIFVNSSGVASLTNDPMICIDSANIKKLKVQDGINKNINNFGLTFPDTTSFTADKEIATKDQIDYIVLKDHTQFGAITGGEAYKMRNGGFIPTFASFNGNQRQSIFIQLTLIAGNQYKATGWFLDASRNTWLFEGTIGGVVEDSTSNITYSNFTETKVVDLATASQLSTKANESVIGDQYDSTQTYAVGDTCIYNNVLYKCTTAITQAEAWDSSHWQATTVAELVADETIITLETTTPVGTTTLSQADLDKFNVIKDLTSKPIYLVFHTTPHNSCKLLINNLSYWDNTVNVYAGIGNINGYFYKVAVYPEDDEIKITLF